jgi:hypothetical protein
MQKNTVKTVKQHRIGGERVGVSYIIIMNNDALNTCTSFCVDTCFCIPSSTYIGVELLEHMVTG